MAPSILQLIDESRLRQVASRYELDLIVLFGSYAKGRAHDDSDVDLAVRTTRPDYGARGPEEEARWEMDLFADLGGAVAAPEGIDLVLLNRADSTLLFEVAREGAPLFQTDRDAFHRFRSLAARRFYDDAKHRRWGREELGRRLTRGPRPIRDGVPEAAHDVAASGRAGGGVAGWAGRLP
ncbi:MAG: hypothetical protein COZ06_34255 [Armatimonadetes bacterium CG_4_10_14_3_um_filter_66_18]|nr:nucleotidyltransferase domain-containing protein [Armatimonadota bacterium]PIU93788.1 MAG: hypothetical protein COS65_11000 [Armatimonadetes bacterium CG06_land_8_20_14_3_00_66_21]PIX40629.1 MAG: hypothetical protein COZ57_25465 [Armatimonadetes bacterium CG_4_8_14_3_um_filter_66_20]PIY36882.1 MAG: hypothetical protein COZ06_34255 [Armatimonadetes bacterium CG_4_10_14_3_um_filter_66_18]PIZ33627.1 MAG: hypothetical protein COY42_29765 [Armatimonadetes bacterium CG_4_10_14_0_8_um_filter_66_14]